MKAKVILVVLFIASCISLTNGFRFLIARYALRPLSVVDLEIDIPSVSVTAEWAGVAPLSEIKGHYKLILDDVDTHRSYDGMAVIAGLHEATRTIARQHPVSHVCGAVIMVRPEGAVGEQ